MITTPKNPFIFTHLDKCGGTSVRQMIFDTFKRELGDMVANKVHIPGFTCNDENNVINLDRSQLLKLTASAPICFADHSNYSVIHKLFNLEEPFYFTILREPVSRIISHYYFNTYKQTQKNLTDFTTDELRVGLQGELPHVMTLRLSGYTEWDNSLAYSEKCKLLDQLLERAIENMEAIQVVGLLENISESIKLLNLLNPWGLVFDEPGKLNKNSSDKPVNDKVIELINEYCRYDRVLYQTAVKRFQKDLQVHAPL